MEITCKRRIKLMLVRTVVVIQMLEGRIAQDQGHGKHDNQTILSSVRMQFQIRGQLAIQILKTYLLVLKLTGMPSLIREIMVLGFLLHCQARGQMSQTFNLLKYKRFFSERIQLHWIQKLFNWRIMSQQRLVRRNVELLNHMLLIQIKE